MNNQNNASRLRSDVARILEQCKPPKPNITKEERQALYKLKKDDSIKILPADKGRVTVIMNSEEYDKQIMKLLQDNNTYEKLKSDPTKKYKAKLVNSLKKWKNENKLSYSEYNRLYPTSECHPKFYGLPKVHKQDKPLRPIVSSIGSITYESARYLAKILGPLVGIFSDPGDFLQSTNSQ